MRDTISIPRVKSLHPLISGEVELIIDAIETNWPEGTFLRVTEAYRSFEYQDRLYAQGRTIAGKIVTNSKGGQSYHNYGLALDVVIVRDGVLQWTSALFGQVVTAFKKAGYVWGGDFKSIKDKPHFEKTFGHNWKELLVMYHNDQFIPDTKYVKL